MLSDESEGRGVPSDSDIMAILSNASGTQGTDLTSEKLRKLQKDAQRQQQQQRSKKKSSSGHVTKSNDAVGGSSLGKSQSLVAKFSQGRRVRA